MNIEIKRKPKRTVTVSLGSDSNNSSNNTVSSTKGNLKWNEINSFEDACSNLGLDPTQVLYGLTEKDEIAYRKLKTIAMAINEGEVLDWNNTSQKKWYPYFKFNKLPNHKPEAAKNDVSSVVRFSLDGCNYGCGHSGVCSRVCFVAEEKAHYAGQKFLSIYEDYLN